MIKIGSLVLRLGIDKSAGTNFRMTLHRLNTRESEKDGVKAHIEDARLMELLPLTVLHSARTPKFKGVWMT